MPNGELCKQFINCADLNTCLTTYVSQSRSADIIISICLKQRQDGKAFDDLSLGCGTQEPLQ